MIEIVKLLDSHPENNDKLQQILSRSAGLSKEVVARAEGIVFDVAKRGDEALIECTAYFDGIVLTPKTIQIDPEVIETLAAKVDKDLIAAMREAISNVRYYHERQL